MFFEIFLIIWCIKIYRSLLKIFFRIKQGEITLIIKKQMLIKRQCPFISFSPSGYFLFSFKLIL